MGEPMVSSGARAVNLSACALAQELRAQCQLPTLSRYV